MDDVAVELTVAPLDGLVDEAPAIRVLSADPGAALDLEVSTSDAAGHRWRSATRFSADDSGAIDLSRDAPIAGLYSTVDPAGPFWAMEFRSEDAAPVGFLAPRDCLEYELTVRSDSERASRQIVRRWSAPGVERRELRGPAFAGPVYVPPGDVPAPGVVLIPGSTGVGALEPEAALLASRGYCALVAGYMQADGLPPSLCEIPVEAVGAAVEALADDERSDGERIGVIAASVGTQGALLALSRLDIPARCAIAVAPSSVIWQALADVGAPPKKAAWTHQGEAVPWLPMHGERLIPEIVRHEAVQLFGRHPRPRALHMRRAYEPSLADREAVARAAIEVERIACPLLLLSGDADEMWPASEMAESIASRRRAHGVGADDRLLRFDDAGHFMRPPITPTTVPWSADLVSGGTASGNARAQAAAWSARLDFLGEHLGTGAGDRAPSRAPGREP